MEMEMEDTAAVGGADVITSMKVTLKVLRKAILKNIVKVIRRRAIPNQVLLLQQLQLMVVAALVSSV